MDNLTKKKTGSPGWLVSGIIGGGLLLAVLLGVCAWLLSKGIVPAEIMTQCVLGCVFLAAMAAGSSSAGKRGGGVLAAGALAGLSLGVLISLAAVLSPNGRAIGPDNLKMFIACTAGGAVGGAALLKRRTPKSRKKKSKR